MLDVYLFERAIEHSHNVESKGCLNWHRHFVGLKLFARRTELRNKVVAVAHAEIAAGCTGVGIFRIARYKLAKVCSCQNGIANCSCALVGCLPGIVRRLDVADNVVELVLLADDGERILVALVELFDLAWTDFYLAELGLLVALDDEPLANFFSPITADFPHRHLVKVLQALL
ncbi:hypothetical protein HRbin20_01213 [bacterium HR20]|nr:hypothetical protein HRbin20_01213 [bacterium HR20]